MAKLIEQLPHPKMNVPVPYERAYGVSRTQRTPSYNRGVKNKTVEVEPEFAAFLIDEGELDIEEYLYYVMSEIDLSERVAEDDDIGYEELRKGLREKIQELADANLTSWEDWT